MTLLRDAADKVVALKADLDATLSAFPLPCLWLDETGRILGVHGLPDLNLSPSSTGQLLREVLAPEAASVLHRALARAFTVDEPVTVDYPIATGFGTRVYEARVGAVKSPSRPRRAFVVVHDITERRARETEYRQLVDGSPNGLCIHREYSIVFANQSIARLFGYTRGSELLGRDIRSLLPDHVSADRTVSRRGRARLVPLRNASRGLTKNGGTVEVTVLVSNVVWASGPATLVTVIGSAAAR